MTEESSLNQIYEVLALPDKSSYNFLVKVAFNLISSLSAVVSNTMSYPESASTFKA